MKLLLHMFRKDVRHFFPEILIHITLLIAFAATAPVMWEPNAPLDLERLAPVMLRFLVPQMWLVLISRVIHDEALVGDRQFWITRPYPWQTLLGAKVAFLLAFLNLPVLLMQMYLLHRGHLLVAPAVADLLRFQGMTTVVFLLPFVAIAVVTATFGRLLLSLLGGLVYLGVLGVLADKLTQHRMSPPHLDVFFAVVVVFTLVGSIVLMYARRPVLQVRAALVCLPLSILILYLIAPAQQLIHRAYAASMTGDSIAFDEDPDQQQPGDTDEPLAFDGKNVLLQFPIQFKAASQDSDVFAEGVQLTMHGADNYTWHSRYENSQAAINLQRPTIIGVFVPLAIYNKLSATSVDMELQIAAQTYAHGAAQRTIVPPSGNFPVPGNGYCEANLGATGLQCRYPLRSSPASLRQLQVQEAPCGTSGTVPTTVQTERNVISGLQLGLDPVNVEFIFLGQPRPGGMAERHLCPGAHVVFIPEEKLQREELTLTRSHISLPFYVTHKHPLHDAGQADAMVSKLTPPPPSQP